MRTLRTVRPLLLLSFGIAAFMLFSSGCSRNKSSETAEKFYSDAFTAIRETRFDDAEHLLTASLVLFQQTDNSDKFNEATVILAGLERLRGKLSQSFGHYFTALSYYRQTQNNARLIPVLNALANLYALTGKRDSAAFISTLAVKASLLSGSDDLKAASEFERGRVDLAFKDPANASAHFDAAAKFPSAKSTPLLSFEISLYYGTALTALDRKDDAIRKLTEAELFLAGSGDVHSLVRLKCALGDAFLHFGMYENAMAAFNAGLKTDTAAAGDDSGSSFRNEMAAQCFCGIGEVYLANYAHSAARTAFSKALGNAHRSENSAVIGYCLVRIADCDAQAALLEPTGSAVLQTVSLYEQAYAVFEFDGPPQRKAFVLMKEAVFRSGLHENGDADRLFRRAFELMRTASVFRDVSPDPAWITQDARLLPKTVSSDDWWFRPYAAFLIQNRHIGDALTVVADGMAAMEREKLLTYPLEFQDTTRSTKIKSYTEHVRQHALDEHELLLQQSLAHASIDMKEKEATQARYNEALVAILNEGATIVARYPSLLPLVCAPPLSFERIQRRLSDDASLLSYLTLDDRFYAVIVSHSGGPIAVDLGTSGAIIDRINEFCSLMRSQMKRPADTREDNSSLQRSSLGLAATLIQPIERFIAHRVIVHTTQEIDDLPVHALLLPNGQPVSDTYAVSYAPFLGASVAPSEQRPVTDAVIFGAPSVGPIEAEYGLRSIKNFFANATIFATQSATQKNFLSAYGSMLHFSSHYGMDEETKRSTFAVSGGSLTSQDVYVPISFFLMARPFGAWVLADQRQDVCGVTLQHAAFAMMSGATEAIVQRYPCPTTYTKDFNEFLYSELSAGKTLDNAYAGTLVRMQKNLERNKVYSSAPFFYIEW